MRKTLSIVLVLTMLLSLFTFVPASASQTKAKEPQVSVHASSGQILIAWKNPAAAYPVASVSFYDSEGTLLKTVTEEKALTANRSFVYKITGLTDGVVYEYKMVTNYTDGTSNTMKFSAVPGAPQSPFFLGAEQYVIYAGTKQGTDAFALTLDNVNQRDGKPVIRVINHNTQANVPGTLNTEYGTTNFNNNQYMLDLTFEFSGLEVGTEYAFQFDAKYEGTTYWPAMIFPEHDNTWRYFQPGTDWKTITTGYYSDPATDSKPFTFTATKSKHVFYLCPRGAINLWMDNLTLYKTSDETKTNILSTKTTPAKMYSSAKWFVNNGSAVAGTDVLTYSDMNSITAEWDVSNSMKTNALRFYVKKPSETEYNYVGEARGQAAGSFSIDGLEAGTAYDVKVACVYNGAEVDIKTTTIKTESPLDSEPSEMLVNEGNGAATISWRNPAVSAATLETITLSDAEGNVLKNDFSTELGAGVVYRHTGLTNDTTYEYVLEFAYDDDTVRTYKFAATPTANTAAHTMGTTSLLLADRNAEPAMVITDTTEHYGESTASLKLTKNEKKDLRVGSIPFTFDDLTAQYTIEFDMKRVGSTYLRLLYGGYDAYNTFNPVAEGTWSHRKETFKPCGQWILMDFCGGPATIWLDNLVIYKTADETKTNLFNKNLKAEYFNQQIPWINSIKTVDATEGTDSIEFTWDKTTLAKSLKFYAKKSGEAFYSLKGDYSAKNGEFVMDGLEPGTAYDVKVTQVLDGTETALYTGTITTNELTAWSVSDYSLALGENAVDEITATGTYTASVTVTNNTSATAVDAQLVAGVYNGKKLVSMFKSEPASVRRGRNATLTAEVAVTDATYSVKLFVWNGIGTMKPLVPASQEY